MSTIRVVTDRKVVTSAVDQIMEVKRNTVVIVREGERVVDVFIRTGDVSWVRTQRRLLSGNPSYVPRVRYYNNAEVEAAFRDFNLECCTFEVVES